MVICLERDADLHMVQLMPLPLTVSCFSKMQIGLPFWYRLTWVVPDKGPLSGCVCACVHACVCLFSILRYLTLWHNIQTDPPAVRTGWGWNLISMCVLFVFCINHSFLCHLVYIKVKVFPYSLPSVGPGADPGVQAVSPQVT